MSMKRHAHEPRPVARALAERRADKLRGTCPACGVTRPLSPSTGKCWPCDNLVADAYPNGATDRQDLPRGSGMCNDCAFRPESPEGQPFTPEEALARLHETRHGDSERCPSSTRDVVIDQAKRGTSIFWCHKPFLEARQRWGYDPKSGELTPLFGMHWRACEGWRRVAAKHLPAYQPT